MTTELDQRTAAMKVTRADRARCLDCLHEVERVAGSAGPARSEEWRDDLLVALDDLSASLVEQRAGWEGQDGLMEMVVDSAPHLAAAVAGLNREHVELSDQLGDLRMRLADRARSCDVKFVRSEIADTSRKLRELRSWETDIVYEAYAVDLGTAG